MLAEAKMQDMLDEGIEIGREENSLKTIKRMLVRNTPIDFIAEIMDVSVQEILQIEKELQSKKFD